VKLKPLDPLDDLKRIKPAQRQILGDAAYMLLDIISADQQRGTHVVGRLLPKIATLQYWAHLPVNDVRDATSGACWFYHCHPPEAARADDDEHGHFHLFIHRRHVARFGKLVAGPPRAAKKPPQLSHYVALAMRRDGMPLRWFTVAQSVTGDYVYPAAAMVAAAGKFEFTPRGPLSPTTNWLAAMVKLYEPTLQRLLRARDKTKNTEEILSVADVKLADYLATLEELIV
jgi:hypothetical protein